MTTESQATDTSQEPRGVARTHKFQAEVEQLLHLVIHSLYSHKEIFLRELVSNASDALDKLRFRSLTEPKLASDTPLEIHVTPDPAAGTLTIEDFGIGMNEEELVTNLGTIAHSGSKRFLEKISEAGGDAKADLRLIGQFGVGFYSSWLVADRVEVISRAAGSDQAFRWSSDARHTFVVEPAQRPSHGTSVILHLRDDQREFLETFRLRELITRYSDFVSHPIKLAVTSKRDSDLVDETGKKKQIEETTLETVNQASALWLRPKNEITAEQYGEFYKHLTHDLEEPLAYTHFAVEGAQQFTGLLFLPKQPDPDWFEMDKKRGVRLFVRRVFIMEDVEELLPPWLRFVRGLVDSDDLPLNVSRELLQDSAIVRGIKRQVTKKTLDLLDDLAKERPDDYATFWKGFGSIIKSGLSTEFEYRERIGNLLRAESSTQTTPTSLADYVSRMKEGQEAIYFVIGESRKALERSPHFEALHQRGYEVLFLTDPVDEWAYEALRTFQGKPLVSAMRANLNLKEDDDQKAARQRAEEALKPLLSTMKETLAEYVSDVRVGARLTDSPVCLVIPEHSNHAFLERLLKERGHQTRKVKRILEVNPNHPLIRHLSALHGRDANSPKLRGWIEMVHDQAQLTEGNVIEDPGRFAQRLTELLTAAAERDATP